MDWRPAAAIVHVSLAFPFILKMTEEWRGQLFRTDNQPLSLIIVLATHKGWQTMHLAE